MSASDAPTRTIGGRYRLDKSIGSGGMGTVWSGTDELLGREVAVKEVRFPPEVGEKEQAELRERTMREARATARLSHPNVVTTYDVVEEDGRPYIVMELLPTRSLSTVLREDGPLPPHRVATIGLEMLGALETSHQEGVVHRDVKPGNVLLTAEGRAVLTDFGIATMAGDPALTSTGVVLGSPSYMSPEQARGKRPGADRRPVVARRDALRRGRGQAAVRRGQRPGHADRRHLRPRPDAPRRGPAARGHPRPADQGPGPAHRHPDRPRAAHPGGRRPLDRSDAGARRSDGRSRPRRPHRGAPCRRRGHPRASSPADGGVAAHDLRERVRPRAQAVGRSAGRPPGRGCC